MRVLLITPAAPSKRHINGGATRMHRLYRRLIELGDEVTVVGVFTQQQTDAIAALEDDGFRVRAAVRPRSRIVELLGTLLRHPALLAGLFRRSSKELISSVLWPRLAPLVRDELAGGEHDVVVIESSFAAFWRDRLMTELPVVLVTHEVESVQLLAKGARIGGLGGLLRYLDGRRVRRSEQRCTPNFDGVVTVCEEERRALAAIVGRSRIPQTYVVGNGTDVERFEAVGADPDEQRVLFTGTMAYPPNATGAQWLAREVWPLVRERLPQAELEIAGAAPSHATRALGRLPGITVQADVPEMLPWFARASVCVLPMLEGGGTRLKLADAWAARRAVVSTTNGATGIDCRAGRELLIADSAEDFARAIVGLLENPALRAQLAGNGRRLVERRHDWNQLGAELHGVLQDVIRRRSTIPLQVVGSQHHA